MARNTTKIKDKANGHAKRELVHGVNGIMLRADTPKKDRPKVHATIIKRGLHSLKQMARGKKLNGHGRKDGPVDLYMLVYDVDTLSRRSYPNQWLPEEI